MKPATPPLALVVSLKFHPGHFSHLVANYRLLHEAGFMPVLYVHPDFARMDERCEFRMVTSRDGIAELGSPAIAVFWFPSLRNITEIVRLKLRWRTRIAYVFHEPFEPVARYRTRGFSRSRIAKIWLINLVNIVVLALSQLVILPSESAYRRFESAYRWMRRPHVLVPLLFDDEAGAETPVAVKRLISYVGTIAPDHAFERFVAFADAAMQHNWFPAHRFAIATASVIPEAARNALAPHIAAGRLTVVEGQPMSTSQINMFYRDSAVVWNAYHGTMQSGVLPKAFMYATPVLGRRGNVNEYIRDGVTGVLIDDTSNAASLRTAVQRIIDAQQHFSSGARQFFTTTFFYRNYLRTFDTIAGARHSADDTAHG